MSDLAAKVLSGDRRAAARLISAIENGEPQAREALQTLYPHTGKAHLVGITGPPGAGKSSLVDHLLTAIRRSGKTVGVIAVDPASPFSGGAILGDRVRMKSHAADPGVFIRSMSSRGQLGGLALATQSAAQVLDAYGCEVVIVETVGVGQNEVAIAQATDTTLLVMPPNLGDGIQAIKAGIMEIPDLFVVNKADLPGARQAVSEIEQLLAMEPARPWNPPVLTTRSLDELETSGAEELWQAIASHGAYLHDAGMLQVKRAAQARQEVLALAFARLERQLRQLADSESFLELMGRVESRELSPESAAARLLAGADITSD